jgi:hypothetical protein
MIPGRIPKIQAIMEDGMELVHDLFHILPGWHEIGGLPNGKENSPPSRFSVIIPFFKFRLMREIALFGLSRKKSR